MNRNWPSSVPFGRTARLLLSATLALASPHAAAAQSRTQPVLADAAMRLELSPTDGHVSALRDGSGRVLAGVATDSVGLWSLDLKPGEGAPTIRATQAGRFTWRKTGVGRMDLVWDRFAGTAAPALRVTATVVIRPDTTVAWHIRLDGIRGVTVDRVHFPRLTGIATSGSGQELAVPSWMGQLARDPHKLLAGTDGNGRRLEFAYPGALSMQAIALSSANQGGLYFASDDTLAFRKSFALWGVKDGTAGFDMVHLLPNPGTLSNYAPSYAALIGVVPGDWLTAVERYRKWGIAQYWARESRLRTGRTPPWLRDTGIWEWNRGRSNLVLEPAAALERDARLPVSVFWHWWHHGPYDTSFPDYLPPREGAAPFTEAVKTAHTKGLHTIAYMNQRLWCVNTPSWKSEGAEKWAVHEHDGTLRLETYNVFDPQPCATMDVATPFWRNKYAGIADTVITQYGVDGIYMDQAVLSLVDWSPDHGHTVGGGNYWMNGFRELAKDLRKRSGSRPIGFAGEGGGESWMPDLDAFLTLQVSQERYADPASGWEVIPMFQAAYHPYALTYGTYGSLTLPPYDELWPVEKRPATAMTLLDPKYVRQFYLEQARMFVWGMQPTIANFLPDQLTARRTEIDYLERLATLRYGLRDFFVSGTFLRAPKVDVQSADVLLSRISIYAARLGGPTEAHINSPEVLSSAWRSADGRLAIALASISTSALVPRVHMPAGAYGLPAGTTIVRHDQNGKQILDMLGAGARTLDVSMEPLEGVVLEFIPPSRAASMHAQAGDTIAARELAPGVAYRQFTDTRGPWSMYLVRVDLRRANLEIRSARAVDQLKGRERVSDMVRRINTTGVRVLAAVNGDFFDLKSGENENNQVIAGEWWKGLKVTDSPYDTYDNAHIQFGMDAARRPLMDCFILDGKAWDRGVVTPIITLNFNPSGKEGTALYTWRYGATTPRDTVRQTAEASLASAGRRGDTLLFVRRGPVSASSESRIPADGAVLAAYGAGARTKEVLAMTEGDTVKVLLATLPRIQRGAAPAMIIGGWPRILRDGENVAGDAATVEGTISRNAEARHPRTSVGFSRDSSTLFVLAVDGRSENSGGMTLVELANMMRQLGAWQAMNFDGGGSTTMVIGGEVVNRPSDQAGERPVGSALLVVVGDVRKETR